MSAADALADFTDTARRRGLILTNPIADGRIHRCPVEGARRGRRDGAYILHLDERPAGWILNWKDGHGRESWRYSNGNGTTSSTPAERAAIAAQRAARKKAAEEERQRAAEAAKREAHALFGNAGPADPKHSYLVAKGIRAHGVRQRGDELLVPRRDMRTDELVSLQRILPNGDKRNLTGGRVDGTWHIIGRPQAQGTNLVGEGFATCATSHEVTGHAAVVAFGSGNLKAASAELRRQYPQARIIVQADDDWKEPGNPGMTAAKKAVLASDALLAVPTFGPDRGERDTDFNDMRRLAGADAVRTAIENAAKPPNPNGNDKAAVGQPGDGGGRGPKQADMLIALADEAELFHTPDGTGFADLDVNGHRETWPIQQKGFRRWLAKRFYETTKGAANSEAFQSALNVIEAKADFDGLAREVYIRVGGLDGKLYLDLCDDTWRAVEIDATGWRVIDRPPVRFRRAAGMQSLPIPQPGGSITRLLCYLNVTSDSDFVLVVSWVLACLRNRGPYPVLVLLGEQGSAKSTFAAILRKLIDACKALLRSLPRDKHELAISAGNIHLLVFDNVSSLPQELSDALCRLATGGGLAARRLYTDQDEVLFDAGRPIILNGIENFVSRPDLADRAIFLTLKPIPEEKRCPEAKLWSEFEAERPHILGALLDAVVEGLKRLPETGLSKLPRMADFALWATACETAMWPAGTFMSAYNENIDGAVEAVIDADAVADAVRTMMTTQTKWEGTAKDLLSAIASLAGERITMTKSWPATPEALRGRLRRAATGLRKIGIEIVFPDKRDRPRNISITNMMLDRPRPEDEVAQLSEPSELSAATPKSNAAKDLAEPERATVYRQSEPTVGQTVGANPLKSNGLDSPDGSDSPNSSASSKPAWSTRL